MTNYMNNSQGLQKRPSSFNNPVNAVHWLLNLILIAIPIVNIIVLIIWATGSMGTTLRKRNFAIAMILAIAIIIVTVVVFGILIFFLIFWLSVAAAS